MLKFLGIGAQKCGTTWLYEHLRRHPQLDFPGGKEIHFWNMTTELNLPWYQGLFAEPDKIQGEMTPAYAVLEPERIALLHSLYPDLKLLYIVRDPVERAWSAAIMDMERSELKYEDAQDEWFIENFCSEASMMRGNYQRCINNWLTSYPREQLLILSYSDISDRPLQLLQRCARHLGVDPNFFVDEPLLKERFFASSAHPIRPNLREFLTQLYADIPMPDLC